jgi:hypothetical protein
LESWKARAEGMGSKKKKYGALCAYLRREVVEGCATVHRSW